MGILFIDTEFTDLVRDPELLSIGIVSMDGREHYVEIDLTTTEGERLRRQSSDFVQYGPVLEQWGRIPDAECSYIEMAQRTADWLREEVRSEGELLVCYDYLLDREFFEYLLKDAGEWELLGRCVVPIDVSWVASRIDGELAAEAEYAQLGEQRDLHRHHALADARALRAAYLSATKPTSKDA